MGRLLLLYSPEYLEGLSFSATFRSEAEQVSNSPEHRTWRSFCLCRIKGQSLSDSFGTVFLWLLLENEYWNETFINQF